MTCRLLCFVAPLLVALSASSSAQEIGEIGDAGELLATAQVISEPVTRISGELSSFGELSRIDDIDMFRFFVAEPVTFSVKVAASLTEDNDAQLFVFDEIGRFVIGDDDGGEGSLPQLNRGSMAGYDPGYYNLAISLYDTRAILLSDKLVGWSRNANPYQYGPYVMTITGAASSSGAVPEPTTWMMMLMGFAGVGLTMRRGRRSREYVLKKI